MSIFYTSDQHFCHENILKLCNRPFGSLAEMEEVLVRNWNDKVRGDDTVYVLGDLFFGGKDISRIETILKQLKGRKHLITGNHDSSWMSLVDASKYFLSVNTLLETSLDGFGMTLCHYPMVTWRHQAKSFMVHGHIHNDTKMDYWPLLISRERVLNASVDINGFAPVTFEELLENNRQWKEMHTNINA